MIEKVLKGMSSSLVLSYLLLFLICEWFVKIVLILVTYGKAG